MGGATAYLLGSIKDGTSLAKIHGDELLREPSFQWIGHLCAFNAYQRYRSEWWRDVIRQPDGTVHEFDLRDRQPEFEERFREQLGDLFEPITEHEKMCKALQKAIDDPALPCVDKLLIRAVGNHPEGFRFLEQQSQVGIPPVAPDVGTEATAKAGAAAGAFGFTIGSAGPGTGALGVYFFEARAGAVFFPTRQLEPIAFTGVRPDEFRAAVQEELGLTLERR